MSNPWVVLAVSVALIAASAFFVAVEFALIAARRHRVAQEATHSRSARAALRSASDLSILLAGSQLGITVCTLALGAVTKPAVHYALTPTFSSWGAPQWLADVLGFALALVVVTFLHLVVGEMAPKSWAIAHPERSAILLAIPMRVFLVLTRPLLIALNAMANWCLRRVGVEPVDERSSGQDRAALAHLVEHSATVGALDERLRGRLISGLDIAELTVGDIARSAPLAEVEVSASAAQVRATARRSGHLRLLVRDGADIVGVVHARDALDAPDRPDPADRTARGLLRPVLRVGVEESAQTLLRTMRSERAHLAVVLRDGRVHGVITLSDIVDRLLATPIEPGDPTPAGGPGAAR